MKYYLGIDIGGTACKEGIVDENGQVLKNTEFSVNFDNYQTPILDTVLEGTKEFMKDNEYQIEGIGVSATGQVNTKNGTIIGTAGHIDNYIGSEIGKVLQDAFNLDVKVINDANCMVLAEQWIGNAIGKQNVVGITIGTGVGGGVIVNGQILLGSNGIAGELGHMIINDDGEQCTCGNHGCYEHYASTSALVRQVKEVIDNDQVNGRYIFEHINDDAFIKNTVNDWINDIVSGLVSLVHIFNPEMVIIGGGVSAQEELLVKPIREKLMKRVMPRFADNLEVKAAKLGNEAGIIGAVYYFINN